LAQLPLATLIASAALITALGPGDGTSDGSSDSPGVGEDAYDHARPMAAKTRAKG